MYSAAVMVLALVLIFHFVPIHGNTHVMVYIGICSLMGSLSVYPITPSLIMFKDACFLRVLVEMLL